MTGVNVKLGMGMAREIGFTRPLYIHGAYYNRRILAIPSPKYCRHILKTGRELGCLPPGL